MNTHYETIAAALRFIDANRQRQPTLSEIAAHCHLSDFHFQRCFQQWAGVSPKQFLRCLNRDYAKAQLIKGASVFEASLQSGFSSSSRLHDNCVALEAVSPGEIRSGGEGLEFTTGTHSSPFGECFIAATQRGIHLLAFVDSAKHDQCRMLTQQWPRAGFTKDAQLTRDLIRRCFARAYPELEQSNTAPSAIRLHLSASSYQLKVWEALLAIDKGQLCSYSAIARAIGQPKASRAVGSAIARNPIAYLIPCHRVIKSMGDFGQYRWGEIRKRAILGAELSATASQTTS